jgi:hypothetical protein
MARPRYCDSPLPPYSYVPGHTPHPVSDPRGHMHGKQPVRAEVVDPEKPGASREFLHGVDLFNHGYYWEAHEAWESLWLAVGRTGPTANFLKALIKLAAAAVKVCEGNARGASRHARRAGQLVSELRSESKVSTRYCGIELGDIERIAVAIDRGAEAGIAGADPQCLLDHWLRLQM